MGTVYNKQLITDNIFKLSNNLGFDAMGISRADKLEDDFERFENWLANGYQANMNWINLNKDKRQDPRLLVENAKSIISFIFNYYQHDNQDKAIPRIAKYALGKDYHKVLKKKLKPVITYLNNTFPNSNSRIFVDSAPVMEHAWAYRAGLGWVGKHSLLINRKIGSYFFIAEIITDVELVYNQQTESDFCGSCQRCIVACPTNAIRDNRSVDSNKCISYHTIENRENLPEKLKTAFGNQVFGCDICQDVCPYNKKPVLTTEQKFIVSEQVKNLKQADYLHIDEEQFNQIFEGSPVKRTGYEGIVRNVNFIRNNLKQP